MVLGTKHRLMMKWVLFVCFISASLISVNAQDPEIVDEIWPEVKPIGRTARLNCTVANKLTHTVIWTLKKDGQADEVISRDESIYISINPSIGGLKKYEVEQRRTEDRQTYMLIIRRLRESDAGKYECSVKIQAVDHTKFPRKLGSLTVQVAPTIRPGDTSTILQVDPGSNATLNCAASGIPAPNITWVRSDGKNLPSGSAQSRGAELKLINVQVEHAGVYRCVADNSIKPPAHHLAQVLIFYAPLSRTVQDSVGQAQNRRFSAKLECIVQGYPEPSVKWKRLVNGGLQDVNDNDKFEINKQTTDNQNLYAREQWYTLKVKTVQANDFVDYFCTSENPYGKAQSTIRLFETTECQGPNCPSLAADANTINISSAVVMAITAISIFMSMQF